MVAAIKGPIKIRGSVNSRDVDSLVSKLLALPKDARREVNKSLQVSAQIVRSDAILSIRSLSPSSGAKTRYTPRRSVFPAEAGNPPNWDTGVLAANIKAVAKLKELAYLVEARAKYSRPLEFGFRDVNGSFHGPWPFLFPALEKNRRRIVKIIALGVVRAFARNAARKR